MDINIGKIAELSSLEIDDSKFSDFEKQFREIVNMISEMPEYSDDHILPDTMELRDDLYIKSKITQDELLKNSAETFDNCFAAPKTVEY